MRFLCDVHISYKLTNFLISQGFDSKHVNEILDKSETKDSELCNYADQNNFVIISKDSDFRDSYFVKQSPKKLIKINLGNIPNEELIKIFKDNITVIQGLDDKPNFLLEIDKDDINLIVL
jgi:predicted nuclease of predicted toxin-antitoxin system